MRDGGCLGPAAGRDHKHGRDGGQEREKSFHAINGTCRRVTNGHATAGDRQRTRKPMAYSAPMNEDQIVALQQQVAALEQRLSQLERVLAQRAPIATEPAQPLWPSGPARPWVEGISRRDA